jgi:nitroreductase
MPESDLAVVERVIAGRRTVKSFTGAPVERATVERLLALAPWAPNHRMHQPWRFAVLDQAAIVRLGAFLRAEPAIAAWPDPAKAQAKLGKLLDRLPQAGVLIQACWVRDADPGIDLEDHAAAAAAIEHILLGAHALGLAGYWSTTAALAHPATLRWCGFDPAREAHLGCLWLGVGAEHPPVPPRRPLAEVARFL